MATSVYRAKPFGIHALADDVKSKEEGRCSLSEYTGKEFCQQVWRTCFNALGGKDAFLVIMTLGPMEDAPEGLPLVPANFLVCIVVPQIEVLRLHDAFVTHGGTNVPIFGDQPSECGHCRPIRCRCLFPQPAPHPEHDLVAYGSDGALGILSAENPYRVASHAMRQRFEDAGGRVPAAVDIILKHAACVGTYKPVPPHRLSFQVDRLCLELFNSPLLNALLPRVAASSPHHHHHDGGSSVPKRIISSTQLMSGFRMELLFVHLVSSDDHEATLT